MDFKQLSSFVTVARTGSFSRAADALFISQPGVSAHVASLEKELGTALFERTKKPLTLTDAGLELFEYAENALKLKERMAAVGKSTRKTLVRIGASTIPSAYYLPELLCRYRRAHPETVFQITRSGSVKTIHGLAEGLFDFALVGIECAEPGIRFYPVAEDRMVLIAPDTEEYRRLAEEEEPLGELLKKPLILREEGSGSGERLKRIAEGLGLTSDRPDIVARTDDTEAIKAMVAGGLGVACVSGKAVTDGMRHILTFRLPETVATRKLYLAKNETLPLRPAAADLIRFALGGKEA